MIKVVFFLLLFCNTYLAFAQKSMTTKEFAIGERRRGYVGLSAGPSMPVGDFNDEGYGRASLGLQANVDFGYLFSENLGITARLHRTTNDFREHPTAPKSEPWKYYGLLAGPLLSGTVARNLELTVRPMVGVVQAVAPAPKDADKVTSQASLAANMGVSLQLNAFSRVGFHLNLDYYLSRVKFDSRNDKSKISAFTPSLGVAYRFH